MLACLRRHRTNALLGGLTAGVVLFYIRQIWETWQGLRVARRQSNEALANKPAHSKTPHVTIVLPARNEARNIRRCVVSLLAQSYANVDIIVVDDGSTDATPQILAELQQQYPRLIVVQSEDLPPGWAGKPHALATGAAYASRYFGDEEESWLLFTDADTMHRPGALAWAVGEGERFHADLLSVLTQQEYADRWNHIILPVVFMGITAQYPPARVANPRRHLAIANGQYLLIRRTVYDRIGGFASPALRGTVLDDRDLAAIVKASGGTVTLLDGRDMVSVCMYRSLAEAWRGWGKNAYAGSRGGPLFFALMALGLPIGTVLPYVLTLIGLVSRKRALLLAGSAQVAAIMAYRWQLDRQLGHARLWGWTHPVGSAVLTALLGRVAWRQATRRGVEWSGRTYLVRQDNPATRVSNVAAPAE